MSGPQHNDFMKYSSLGIQLMVIILACTFGGKWLDGKIGNETPWIMVVGSILGLVFAMVYMIKETSKDSKNKK